jgi:hypothetical protein
MKNHSYGVYVPNDIKPYPEEHERTAARIIADFFHSDAIFIKRTSRKTPDIRVDNLYWEIKSPTGKGKHNIQHRLQNAAEQSENIVLDARRSKIHHLKIKNEAIRQFSLIKKAKRLILITKTGKAIELKKQI